MANKVKLVEQSGPTSIYIDVCIDEEGDLLLSGQDLGEAPRQAFGDSDYEYFLSIPAAEKDKVLLALMEKVYSGNASVFSDFRKYLEAKDIAFEAHTS